MRKMETISVFCFARSNDTEELFCSSLFPEDRDFLKEIVFLIYKDSCVLSIADNLRYHCLSVCLKVKVTARTPALEQVLFL